MTLQPVIQAKGIGHVYAPRRSWPFARTRGLPAAQDVDIILHAGRTVALVGESGCGKTTVGRMIAGQLGIHAGTVSRAGDGPTKMPLSRTVQYVSQDPLDALDPKLTIRDQVIEPLNIHRLGARTSRGTRADAMLAMDRPKDALDAYTEVLEYDPTLLYAYVGRARAWRSVGNLQRAVVDYIAALNITPGDPDLLAERGTVLAELGDHESALSDFNKVLAIYPDQAGALYGRGVVYGQQGSYELALADFNHLIEIAPELGDAYFMRGMARLAMGDELGAEDDFMSAYANGAQNDRLDAILRERGIIE